MSILVDKNTQARRPGHHRRGRARSTPSRCVEYGTKVVGGVTPGKGGADVRGQGPGVRHRRRGGRRRPAPTPRVIYVPPPFAADAILEAVDAGHRSSIVCITEGIPVLDMVKVQARARRAVPRRA